MMLSPKGTHAKQLMINHREELGDEFCRDQFYSMVNICKVPDVALLEILDFYLGSQPHNHDAWHKLVHVCRQWRYVVFASPRRLNLRLLCTQKRSASKMLEIWPSMPIVISRSNRRGPQLGIKDTNNMIAALKHHGRICKIHLESVPIMLWEIFLTMKESFPELTELWLLASDENMPVVSDTFLGGSAPRLRSLLLNGISFPELPKLLLSTSDLVELRLFSIPRSGYFPPETMVSGLSALTRLDSLYLEFRSPRSRDEIDERSSRHLYPLTRIILPAFTVFNFKGNSEYLEAMVSRIDAPLLHSINIVFFNQLLFDTPLLRHFISRTEAFKVLHRAYISFSDDVVGIRLGHKEATSHGTLIFEISCIPSDWQLSSLAQLCNSSLPSLPLEHLDICQSRQNWQGDMVDTQWLEILHPFTSVKNLYLSNELVGRIVPAVQELTGESVLDVLPELESLSLKGYRSKPVKDAIAWFVAARQLSSHPVIIRHEN